MRHYTIKLTMLLAAVAMLASCLKDDNETVTYQDDVITSFGFTQAMCNKIKTKDDGTDSLYQVATTIVSSFPFHIDQNNNLIFNTDSLPYNTVAEKMMCTYTTRNNAYVLLEAVGEEGDKLLLPADTLDFSKPRVLKVYANDGNSMRRYTVSVRVHQQDGTLFTWNLCDTIPGIKGSNRVRVFCSDKHIFVAGANDERTVVMAAELPYSNEWVELCSGLSPETINSMAQYDDNIVLDNGENFIVVSATGVVQTQLASQIGRILGASKAGIFATDKDGAIIRSVDCGTTWVSEALDEDKSLLPTEAVCFSVSPYKYSENAEYLMIAGCRNSEDYPDDESLTIWRKVQELESDAVETQWSHISIDEQNRLALPKAKAVAMFPYDGKLLAVLAGTADNADTTVKKFYESRDGGITWKAATAYEFPYYYAFNPETTVMDATSDSASNIWIVNGTTGTIGHGRLNRLGWQAK